jgi:hypothetical protein
MRRARTHWNQIIPEKKILELHYPIGGPSKTAQTQPLAASTPNLPPKQTLNSPPSICPARRALQKLQEILWDPKSETQSLWTEGKTQNRAQHSDPMISRTVLKG